MLAYGLVASAELPRRPLTRRDAHQARARSGPRLPEDASGPWWATRALAQDSAEGGASGLSDRKLISDPCADDSCERCADVESVRRATPARRGAGPGTTA
mmetsp:Transcript_65216/g.204375  ORF Transcript_65216/g.204375 Transcript_65216/m.204375 type:complete len:100 (-) Transcript_65216:556-855(-)